MDVRWDGQVNGALEISLVLLTIKSINGARYQNIGNWDHSTDLSSIHYRILAWKRKSIFLPKIYSEGQMCPAQIKLFCNG